MSEHRFLASDRVHEPKHITTSTIADAGKVITPAGGGTSVLRFLTPDDIGMTTSYVQLSRNFNAGTFILNAAADTTLNTLNQYTELTTSYIVLGSVMLRNASVNGNALVLGEGVHRINGKVNMSTTHDGSSLLGLCILKNGSPVGIHTKTFKTADTDQIDLYVDQLLEVDESDEISLAVAVSETATVAVNNALVSAQLVWR